MILLSKYVMILNWLKIYYIMRKFFKNPSKKLKFTIQIDTVLQFRYALEN